MHRITALAATALAIGLLVALPAGSSAATAAPKAHAAGSDGGPPVLPSIVRVRIARGEKALEHAGDYVDRDMPDRAVASLLNARRNMYAAWRGAVYVIEHAPPPPPPGDRSSRSRRVHTSGAAAGPGSNYATPEQTGIAVLNYQHDVATAAYGLLDGAKGALRDSVSTTIFAALNRRDQAIAYIALIPPPPPPEGRVHVSGAVVAAGWGPLMQGLLPDLDDELQQIDGLTSFGSLTTGEKRILRQAEVQIVFTERTINTTWPPVPAD